MVGAIHYLPIYSDPALNPGTRSREGPLSQLAVPAARLAGCSWSDATAQQTSETGVPVAPRVSDVGFTS